MRKIVMSLTWLVLTITIFVSEVYADEVICRNDFEEDADIIKAFGSNYTKIGNSLILKDGHMNVHTDKLVLYSNEGFFLSLYDLVYTDPNTMLTEPRSNIESKDLLLKYDVAKERRLRINRLIQDGYILEEETNKYPITKQTLATILYRIYKDIMPFKKSVAYADTDDEAIRWAAEKGLPNFLYRSGYNINPEDSLQEYFPAYMATLCYAYIYFPNPITNEYRELEKEFYVNEELNFHYFTIRKSVAKNYIEELREEVMKPRLGYWLRDVMNNEEISDIVKVYTETNSEKVLNKIHQYLKKEYNLYSYQDYIGYIRYMFSEYNH